MSSKNNVNTDHYKTRGRGRQGDGILYGDYKNRLKKARRRRGLSAKQLLERKMSRRTIRHMQTRASVPQA